MAGHGWVGMWGEEEQRENQITKLSKAICLHIPFVIDKILIKMNFCFDSTILFNLGEGGGGISLTRANMSPNESLTSKNMKQ